MQTHGCVVSDYSQSFKVIFGVHPASLLIPLLFIIVFEALLRSSLLGSLSRLSCHHYLIALGMCPEALDIEKSHGGEEV